MTQKPVEITNYEEVLLQPYATRIKVVDYGGHANAEEGVATTDAENPRVASYAFSPCTALLLENTDTKEMSLYHFFPEVVTQSQISALEKARESGAHFRGVFVTGLKSHKPGQEGDFHIYGTEGTTHTTLKDVVDKTFPGIEWHPTVKVDCNSWSLAYDAGNGRMQVEHMRSSNSKDSDYYDYGSPFNRTVEPPASQIEQDGACFIYAQHGWIR